MQEYASSYSSSTLLYCGNEMITSAEWDAFLRVWDGTDVSLGNFQLSITRNFNRLLDCTENESDRTGAGTSLLEDEAKERLHRTWLDAMGNWYNLEIIKMDSEENQRSLLTWVRSARSTVATDPRDKIYACFGFLPQHVREVLDPSGGFQDCDLNILINDYDVPVHNVYASFVRAVISSSKKLSILCDCFRRSSLVKSTWIPDWTQPEIISILGSEFQRTPKSWCAASDTAAVTNFSDDLRVLTVRGVRVRKLRQKFERNPHSSNKVQQLIDFFRICKDAMLDRGVFSNTAFNILWETFFVFFQYEKPSDDREEQQFYSWLFQNVMLGEGNRLFEGECSEHSQDFLYRANDEAHYLGLTDNRCIGRFPFHSERRDLICIILGSDTPVILRPVDNYFELVGACYVDGLMYGEGLKGLDDGALQLEDFEIH